VRKTDEETQFGGTSPQRGESPVNLRRWARYISGILLLISLSTVSSRAEISYLVSLEHPEQHVFHVTITIPDVHGSVTVQMAAWNALYQIHDFSSHVQHLEAFAGSLSGDAGKHILLTPEKIDKQSWRVQAEGTVSVRYAVYWDEPGPFATQLNTQHAFINPAMILMYVPERRGEAVTLFLSELPPEWNVASSAFVAAVGVGGAAPGSRSFLLRGSTYDGLADAPIEAGKFQRFDLSGIGASVSVVVHGDNWQQKRLDEELRRICQYEIKLMEDAPFEHYTFILHFGKGAGGGGMEHSYSTAIGVSSSDYLAGVAAHEFFHLWNVKRIRPASLEPVDYTKEQYTRALWFAEGVTSTYGAYTLLRSGIWNKEKFYEDLSEQITELEERPANRWQSAEQSSLDAWLEKYALYNRPDFSVSYYTKGQILGNLLDILIRDRTNNAKSLDDVLRAMNQEFAKRGKFYRDSLDVRLTAEKVTGESFEDFFAKYVAGTEAFPYRQVLGLAGLEVRTIERRMAVLGFTAARDAYGALIVRDVEADGPAARAGLRVGDAIVAWNGDEAPRWLARWANEQKPGDALKLRIRRDEKETSLEFRLGEAIETMYEVAEDSLANEKARNIREGLLRGETGSVSRH
jgi:predicted metalloprotease with PDZ domain